MEATGNSETSVNFYHITRRNNPEDSELYNRCRENLKSQMFYFLCLGQLLDSFSEM
jgi:hypothetical protein